MSLDELKQGNNFSLQEEILIGRLLEKTTTLNLHLCATPLEWKAWKFPGEMNFASPKTKTIYEKICYTEEWVVYLNKIWDKQWPMSKANEQVVPGC